MVRVGSLVCRQWKSLKASSRGVIFGLPKEPFGLQRTGKSRGERPLQWSEMRLQGGDRRWNKLLMSIRGRWPRCGRFLKK